MGREESEAVALVLQEKRWARPPKWGAACGTDDDFSWRIRGSSQD